MKLAKWLMATASALLVCACSKGPLAYVEENADKVIYFNTTAEMNENTIALIKQKGNLPEYSYFENGKFLGVDMFENKAEMAFWSTPLGGSKGAIVLEDVSAEDFIKKCAESWEEGNKSKTTSDITVDGNKGKKFENEIGKKAKTELTLVAASKDTVLVYFGDKEVKKLLKASNANKVAEAIDTDAIWAVAKSGEPVNEKQNKTKKNGSFDEDGDPYQVLTVGNSVKMLLLDGDELKNVNLQDISDID